MHFILVGLNHETAPVEVCERLAFHRNRLGLALAKLTRADGGADGDIVEAVILSTCNRVEIYALAKNQNLKATRNL